MSTDLVLVVPATGEVVQLDAATDLLADQFDRIAEMEQKAREVRNEIRDELLSRMDKEGARRHQAGGLYLECEAPGQTDYDAEQLSEVLASLVADDKISAAFMGDALKREVTYKPMKRALGKLLATPTLTDEDRAAIEACAKPATRQRRLTVKRASEPS